jgi:hypothetical protein
LVGRDSLGSLRGWFDAATGYGVREPYAMVRATADATGTLSTRIVPLKGFDPYGPEEPAAIEFWPARAQRPAHRVPALDATAERLPFDDDCFDAALVCVSAPVDGHRRRLTRATVDSLIDGAPRFARVRHFCVAGFIAPMIGCRRGLGYGGDSRLRCRPLWSDRLYRRADREVPR